MILSYIDILGDGQRHEISATVTTDHPLSSYGQRVVLLHDGAPLDASSWVLMGYQVHQIDPDEHDLMQAWLSNLYTHITMSALGRRTSPRKAASSAANGRRGGRPPKPMPDP